MPNRNCIIIFGAAVLNNGEASGALRRRVTSALSPTLQLQDNYFLATGGVGKNNFSEAQVMRTLLLQSGIQENKIILDDKSNDTLASIVNCTRILKSGLSFDNIFVCTDEYHIFRCRWLFRMCGIRTKPFTVITGLGPNGIGKWIYYYIREFVAIPYDTILILFAKK